MAIHTLLIGETLYEIQPMYASSAGYAELAGGVIGYGKSNGTSYPLVFANGSCDAAGTAISLYTDTLNSLNYNPNSNVLTVPRFRTSNGPVSINAGSDLQMIAASGSSDSGDLVFFRNANGAAATSTNEVGRIWVENRIFKLRYSSSDAAKTIIHSGNITGQTAGTALKTQCTLTIEHDYDGNTTNWDGSSDQSINSIAYAQVAGSVKLPLTIFTSSGITYTYDGSTSIHVSGVSYASSASKANYASSATYANYSKYLHAATSTSKLYLLGQTVATSGGNLVYKNANTYISSNAIYASAGFYESSDARLKTITNDVEVDFERLKSIPKIQYIKKGETAPHIGTIAQDLQKVYPEFVETGEDGYMSVDYAKLSIIPLKAVDLLYDEVNKLKDEIKTVKEENQMLKDRLDNIEAIINR